MEKGPNTVGSSGAGKAVLPLPSHHSSSVPNAIGQSSTKAICCPCPHSQRCPEGLSTSGLEGKGRKEGTGHSQKKTTPSFFSPSPSVPLCPWPVGLPRGEQVGQAQQWQTQTAGARVPKMEWQIRRKTLGMVGLAPGNPLLWPMPLCGIASSSSSSSALGCRLLPTHLGLGQLQLGGEFGTFGQCQVLGLLEPANGWELVGSPLQCNFLCLWFSACNCWDE